eukprot:CAMPEP_0179041950 /NCGR_PEP_ID=MMETSP0796-20121207/16417_1 /TAXON_ID=73915 /ORGANISM="Pyrodinium bahamense, Strain pbaha01" /LENGTH=486 /DNA_ID=CAMNT_0020738323 /DNA_START=70 /DNA_END=1530 /DNA_ORIENTATION=-
MTAMASAISPSGLLRLLMLRMMLSRCVHGDSWWAAPDMAPPTIGIGMWSSPLARPVAFNMGPFVDFDHANLAGLFEPSTLSALGLGGDTSEELSPSAPRQFEALFGQLWQDLADERSGFVFVIPGLLGDDFAPAARAKGFQVSQLGGHWHLEASLPGYKSIGNGMSKEAAQPLNVELVGRSLVVRGRQAFGQVVRSFQRSFQLPRTADVDAIQVVYNSAKGMLSVDIPPKSDTSPHVLSVDTEEDAEGADLWPFEAQDSGSQVTLTLVRRGRKAASGLHLLDELLAYVASTSALMPEIVQRSPLAVHPKNARPFWRLAEDLDGAGGRPAIEVVVPHGVALGRPQHGQSFSYGNEEAKLRGAQEPKGEVKLPIAVGKEDCTWVRSPVPPLWMAALSASIAAATGVWFACLACRWVSSRRASAKVSVPMWKRIFMGTILVLLCILLLALASSFHAARLQAQSFEEKVLRCKIGQDSLKKVNIGVVGEL